MPGACGVAILPAILDQIVAAKRQEVARAKAETPESVLRGRIPGAAAVRDFLAALSAGPPIRLIAEVKKASPSKGVIRADFDPVAIARIYRQHGASCLSVLTDRSYFQGSLEHLRQVRAAVDLPVLRKDFVIDPYQVVEARVAGADAVLLIAECLDDDLLERLYNTIVDLGMTPLVELYEPANLARVLRLGARLVGINNRDLRHVRDRSGAHAAAAAANSRRSYRRGRERHPQPAGRPAAGSRGRAGDARRRNAYGQPRYRRRRG